MCPKPKITNPPPQPDSPLAPPVSPVENDLQAMDNDFLAIRRTTQRQALRIPGAGTGSSGILRIQ